ARDSMRRSGAADGGALGRQSTESRARAAAASRRRRAAARRADARHRRREQGGHLQARRSAPRRPAQGGGGRQQPIVPASGGVRLHSGDVARPAGAGAAGLGVDGARAADGSVGRRRVVAAQRLLDEGGVLIGLALVFIVFGALVGPRFFSVANLELIAR